MNRKKGLYLSVPTPCGENWDKMTVTAAGKHCVSCDKTVIDFSLMTDAEIFAVINNSQGKVCGKFTDEQLNRAILPPPEPRHSFVPAMLLTAGLMVGIANEGHAETRQLEQLEVNITPAGDTTKTPVVKSCDLPEVVVTGIATKVTRYTVGAVAITGSMIEPVCPVDPVYPTKSETRKHKKKRWFR